MALSQTLRYMIGFLAPNSEKSTYVISSSDGSIPYCVKAYICRLWIIIRCMLNARNKAPYFSDFSIKEHWPYSARFLKSNSDLKPFNAVFSTLSGPLPWCNWALINFFTSLLVSGLIFFSSPNLNYLCSRIIFLQNPQHFLGSHYLQ